MTEPTSVDVVIVGAGLSGIGMACHVQRQSPDKRYVILEARQSMGGTWDLFRYPGVRSDSDMYTLGYKFRPWEGTKDIADGPSILQYIKDTAAEHQVDKQIRYGHSVRKASWSSQDCMWTLEVVLAESNRVVRYRCNMLLMCAGYYSYESGYTPQIDGRNVFRGQIIVPQAWPSDLDYSNKRVVVIGSGATAVTLVPAMAEKASQVTMLQRSPTYMVTRPSESRFGSILKRFLPKRIAHKITRWYNIRLAGLFYRRSREHPERIRQLLLDGIRRQLDDNYDVDRHFTPHYDPWDQRVCIVPDGDLFKSITAGKTKIITDQIDRFTEDGILLKSGDTLFADIVVMATGLVMQVLGGTQFFVDGCRVDFSKTFTYLGMMYSGVPNLVTTFGYINASWTLRADLTSEFVCRLLRYMDGHGWDQCTPTLRESDRDMKSRPFIDNFSSNYIQRALPLLPRQGDRQPWINSQDYQRERKLIGKACLNDGCLVFANRQLPELR